MRTRQRGGMTSARVRRMQRPFALVDGAAWAAIHARIEAVAAVTGRAAEIAWDEFQLGLAWRAAEPQRDANACTTC